MTLLRWMFSSKHYEIKIVFATLSVLICLPIISVVVFASSGLSLVSSALAAVNPITHLVEILDPNGNKIAELELSTAWPTKGYISDEFGTNGGIRDVLGLGAHTGIDIANEHGLSGEPVTTFLIGTVTNVDNVDDSHCGKSVRVNHDNNIQSLYCHLANATAVEKTQVVPGDVIGYMGSSGTSTGAHTHFQIEVFGIPVNPRTFMVGVPERSTVRAILPTF